jgi:hypothetical protein
MQLFYYHNFTNSYSIPPIDIIAMLEAIVDAPMQNTTLALSYREEIKLLESALSVLTHYKILPGSITLDPSQNDKVVNTGFYESQ